MNNIRDEFARRQAQMTANWFEGVKQNAADVARYIEGRQNAYLDRWNEGLRFVKDGASILDIGGGNLYEQLLLRIKSKGLDYWYLDVDEGAVAGTRAVAEQYGFNPNQFSFGFNDKLSYESASFDAVFSSHCIEHSFDLDQTFAEIRRVLRPGGKLLMAVPFGWELNPEHPYFFATEHWLALLEDAGFQIRVAQVGREYPESGYDLFVAASKLDEVPSQKRVNPALYCKNDMEFVSPFDERVKYSGETYVNQQNKMICKEDWSISIECDRDVGRILPILERHAWSGVIEIRSGDYVRYVDLYSWFSFPQPVQVDLGRGSRSMIIKPCGKNELALGTECALSGFLLAN